MKPLLPYLAVPLLGLFVGWVTAPTGNGSAAGVGESTPAPSPRHLAGTSLRAEQPWNAEDFIRSVANSAPAKDTPNPFVLPPDPLMAYLADWSDAEIRAALDQSILDPELLLPADGSAGVTHNLFRQLIQRDFSAASAWFSALPENLRHALASTYLWNWPSDRAEEGLAFLRAHPHLAAGREQRIVNIGLTAAAARGPADFIATFRSIQAEYPDNSYGEFYSMNCGVVPGFSFPPSFDFPALLASDALGFHPATYGSFTGSVFSGWQSQDREAAFTWIMENHGPAALAKVTGSWEDRASSASWFNSKMAAMPAPQRAELLRARLEVWTGESYNAQTAVAASRGTPIHQEVLTHAVQSMFYGKYSHSADMIEGIEEPEERLRFLEQLDFIPSGEPVYTDPEENGEPSLREKLRSWGADDARASAIIARLRQGRGEE